MRKSLLKLLKDNGFVLKAGGKGSHQKFYNEKTNITVIVPISKEIPKGTLHAILKQAGLK